MCKKKISISKQCFNPLYRTRYNFIAHFFKPCRQYGTGWTIIQRSSQISKKDQMKSFRVRNQAHHFQNCIMNCLQFMLCIKWVLCGGQKNQNKDFIFRLLWQVVWALQLQLYGVQEESCSGMATPDDAPCHVSSKSLCSWCICFCCSTMLRSIDAKNDNLKKKEMNAHCFCFDYWVEVHKSLVLNLWLTNIICFSENPRRNQ